MILLLCQLQGKLRWWILTSLILRTTICLRQSTILSGFLLKKTGFWGQLLFSSKAATEAGTVGVRQSFDLNLKKIAGDWTIMAEVSDLFNQSYYRVNGIQPDGKYNNITNFSYPRLISIGVTYNFGNQKLKKQGK